MLGTNLMCYYERMKGFEAHTTMKDGARPVFVKRKIHYALKKAVEAELEKRERNGVIKKQRGQSGQVQ